MCGKALPKCDQHKVYAAAYIFAAGERGNMTELVPSKDVREFIEKRGKIFTDFEKAAIVYNLCLPYEKKRFKLMELRNTTENEELRKQLGERMEYLDKCLELYAHKDAGYVYLLLTRRYEEIFGVSGCYAESDLAYFWGKKTKQPFMIEKHQLVGADDFVKVSTSEGSVASMPLPMEQNPLVSGEKHHIDSVAVLHFDEMGELLYVYSWEKDWEDREVHLSDEEDDLSRFEHAYVEIPNPFNAGDWVRVVDDGKCGVVCTSQEKWKQDNEWWKKQSASFENIGVVVRFIEDNGRIEEESINPLFLEYVPSEKEQDKKSKERGQK